MEREGDSSNGLSEAGLHSAGCADERSMLRPAAECRQRRAIDELFRPKRENSPQVTRRFWWPRFHREVRMARLRHDVAPRGLDPRSRSARHCALAIIANGIGLRGE